MWAAVDIFEHVIGGQFSYAAATGEVGSLVFARGPCGHVRHGRADSAPTGARLSSAECQTSATVDLFGHVIGGRVLYAAATAEAGCLVLARLPTGTVRSARPAGALTGERLSSEECQMSAAVDIVGKAIGGRFLEAVATAEVGCRVFALEPTGLVGHARAAGAPAGAHLSNGECQMWAPVDLFGHDIDGHYMYAAAMAEQKCRSLARIPNGPVGHARAAGAPTGARLSSLQCQTSATVDLFGHVIGGRVLYAAATAEAGCLVLARVPTGTVRSARAAGALTGAPLPSAECQMSTAVDIVGQVIGGRFLQAAATAEVGCLVFAVEPTR